MSRFTRLLVCAGCGARCYRRFARGVAWYICGRETAFRDCPHPAHAKEDRLIEMVQHGFARMFTRGDEIVTRATTIAAEQLAGNRADADRLAGQLRTCDAEERILLKRLMDPDIHAAAKQVVGRELADVEDRRVELLAELEGREQQAACRARDGKQEADQASENDPERRQCQCR